MLKFFVILLFTFFYPSKQVLALQNLEDVKVKDVLKQTSASNENAKISVGSKSIAEKDSSGKTTKEQGVISIAQADNGKKTQSLLNGKNVKVDINIDSSVLSNVGGAKIEVKTAKNTVVDMQKQDKPAVKPEDNKIGEVIKVASKKEDEEVESQKEKKDNDDSNLRSIEKKSKLDFLGFGKDDKKNIKDEENVEISGKYDGKNETKVLVIKDGVKNINISFKPEIKIGDYNEVKLKNDALQADLKTKNNKNVAKKENAIIKKKISKKNTGKKNKKINVKINKKNKKIVRNNSVLQNNDVQQPKTDEVKNVYKEVKTIGKENNNVATRPKTIRQIYEASNVLQDESSFANAGGGYGDTKRSIGREKEAIIKQETPVYIINRIISVDENMNLTEEAIEQIINENDGSEVKRVRASDNDGFKTAYLGGSEFSFINQYNIVEADNLKYGEVAFINDYND